ncbi:MAG: hypothetical protein WBQ50_08840 [Nocardioides sp.]
MRSTRTALALFAAWLLLAGCGNDAPTAQDPEPASETSASTPSAGPSDEPSEEQSDEPSEEPTEEETRDKPRPTGPFADLTFEGDRATPNGQRLEIEVGKPLTLRIDSDRTGELHVHSTPEQEIAFPAGQSERKLTIDQPGVVDVEDHDSGLVLLQLEVR